MRCLSTTNLYSNLQYLLNFTILAPDELVAPLISKPLNGKKIVVSFMVNYFDCFSFVIGYFDGVKQIKEQVYIDLLMTAVEC